MWWSSIWKCGDECRKGGGHVECRWIGQMSVKNREEADIEVIMFVLDTDRRKVVGKLIVNSIQMKRYRCENEWERNRWRKLEVKLNWKGTDEERQKWRWIGKEQMKKDRS